MVMEMVMYSHHKIIAPQKATGDLVDVALNRCGIYTSACCMCSMLCTEVHARTGASFNCDVKCSYGCHVSLPGASQTFTIYLYAPQLHALAPEMAFIDSHGLVHENLVALDKRGGNYKALHSFHWQGWE